MTFSELAAGELGSAPTGKNYVRIVKFVQAPGQSIASKKHQAGFIYVQSGLQRLTYTDDGTHVDIAPATALFLQDVNHSHETLPGALSTWYFIALWPDTPQSATLVPPSMLVFKTEDLPPTAMPPGTYTETLRSVSLQPGGRSPAHIFGGLEVVFVLDGTLNVDVAGQAPVQLPAGQATYVPAHTLTQELAAGAGKVDYLAYFITEHGTAFETDSTSATPG
jgi:quercetin dioxygenase-like cupin family protein